MDNVCNRCLCSIPSKVEMAEEQECLCHYGKYFLPSLEAVFSLLELSMNLEQNQGIRPTRDEVSNSMGRYVLHFTRIKDRRAW